MINQILTILANVRPRMDHKWIYRVIWWARKITKNRISFALFKCACSSQYQCI